MEPHFDALSLQRQFLARRGDFPSLARMQNGFPVAYLDGPAGTQMPMPVTARGWADTRRICARCSL